MKSYNSKSFVFLALASAIATAMPVLAQTVAITGGKVYPVIGPPIEGGTVVIVNGRITAVGSGIAIPADAQRIDATGKIVTPGLVNSATELGVQEVGYGAGPTDETAKGKDNIAAAFTVWDGLNPNSVMFAPARKDGITSFVVLPNGGLISGQAALLDYLEVGLSGPRGSRSNSVDPGASGPPKVWLRKVRHRV